MFDKIKNSEFLLHSYFEVEEEKKIDTYKKESKGFIIYDIDCNATFLITTCHGLFWDKGELKKINVIYKKKTRTYGIKNFIFNKKFDLAIKIINWGNLDYNNLLSTSDFDFNLNNDISLFNVDDKIYRCIDHSLEYLIKDDICILYKFCKYDFTAEFDLQGYSGQLNFNRNKIDSVFVAQNEDNCMFIPGFYVKYMIDNFSKSKSEFQIYNLPINVHLNDDKKSLTMNEDYNNLESGSIICKIDDKEINGGYIYEDRLQIPVLPDIYIMLNCGNKCKVSIKKEKTLEEMFLECKLIS